MSTSALKKYVSLGVDSWIPELGCLDNDGLSYNSLGLVLGMVLHRKMQSLKEVDGKSGIRDAYSTADILDRFLSVFNCLISFICFICGTGLDGMEISESTSSMSIALRC